VANAVEAHPSDPPETPEPEGPVRKPHRVFDRPRQRRDWRWVVGGIGRLLIIVGLLMFAFVAYQLWGTGIYTGQAQHRLDDQFNHLAVAATTLPPGSTVPASTSTVATSVVTTAVSSTAPSTAPSTTPASTTPASTSVPAESSTASPTTAADGSAVPYPFALPKSGKVLVQLQIPKIGVNYKVVEGVGLDDLAKGPGHFPESVLPGQLGNSAIAGHRTTHGAPFYDVNKLHPGDQIVLTYPSVGGNASRFVYLVTGTEIVAPSDYAGVVPTTDASKATLVLTSCHPITSATQRIVIRAALDAGQSSPLFAATPRAVPGTGATIPGDDDGAGAAKPSITAVTATTTAPTAVPTTVAPDVVESTTVVAAVPAASTAPETTSVPAAVPATTPAAAASAPPASKDAFAGGWFDDSAAWPHILLWGLALAAITLGGYRLAKRYRRIWLGTLVAFAPFVVVLYFWFENINRLLPPGL
jgi:sortase A